MRKKYVDFEIKILALCILWYSVGYWSCQFDFPFKKQYHGGVLFGDEWLTIRVKMPKPFDRWRVFTTVRTNDFFIFDNR